MIGPISLWAVVYLLSIPITEESMKKTRPNWEEDIKGTNAFLPF